MAALGFYTADTFGKIVAALLAAYQYGEWLKMLLSGCMWSLATILGIVCVYRWHNFQKTRVLLIVGWLALCCVPFVSAAIDYNAVTDPSQATFIVHKYVDEVTRARFPTGDGEMGSVVDSILAVVDFNAPQKLDTYKSSIDKACSHIDTVVNKLGGDVWTAPKRRADGSTDWLGYLQGENLQVFDFRFVLRTCASLRSLFAAPALHGTAEGVHLS